MTTCPKCHKNLLSHASARCNWCGAIIEDAAYQAKAEAEREAFYAQAAAHDAQSYAAIAGLNMPLDPLTHAPLPGTRRWERDRVLAEARLAAAVEAREAQEAVKEEPIQDEIANAEDRFRHLEL